MLPCDAYQDRLLDHLYGLLDPAEAEDLEAHLTRCPACAAAQEQAARVQGLLQHAARLDFPDIQFAPPLPAAPAASPTPAPSANGMPPPRDSVQGLWIRWFVAASLLLTLSGLGGPTVRDLLGYARYKPEISRELAGLDQTAAERDRLAVELRKATDDAIRRVAEAQTKHDEVVQRWVKAEQEAVAAAAERPFTLTVQGPASAVPGAPNEYTIQVTGQANRDKPVAVEAKVQDGAGKVVFRDKLTAQVGGLPKSLKIPASMWTGVPPGTDLFLHVAATDPQTGASSHLTESVRLLQPVYTTFLTTDKPLYRPGETVFFRSLTLDRTRFLPPERELNLRFTLIGPDGRPVPGVGEISGLARPAVAGRGVPQFVLGPDGKPVRGVGCGAIALPGNLPGGQYTLTVTEIPTARDVAPFAPLATRTFLVSRYRPDALLKKLEFDARSYGPGDVVQAKLEVLNQARPLAGAMLQYVAEASFEGGRRQLLTLDVAPTQTDAAGTAALRFTLPAGTDLESVSLTVTIRSGGINEAITRRVPLATRKLMIEFFPEGGDLVLGVPNRVYFRATTSEGKPADVAGVLTDGAKTLTEVKTLTDPDHPGVNQGLGVFTFTPEPGKRYAVRLQRPVGVVQLAVPYAAALGVPAASTVPAYELPRAKTSGVVLSVPDGVSQPGEKLRVKLWSVGKKRSVIVGAYTRGRPIAHQRVALEPGQPTEVLLDPGAGKLGGVTRVTVFEEPEDPTPGRDDLKPVAERLVFRQSGEALKLAFQAGRGAGQPGPFAPGETVELTVTATDEANQPKPAILWASVVNQSVITMADEKAARLLPTHFLLGGEVRKGDELEHADFLLTDHPRAEAALDLLLGTQGWRRFAEQAPELFRSRYQAEAEQLLVASGARGGVPLSWRAEVRRVFDVYWPQYEAAVLNLTEAETDQRSGASSADLQTRLTHVEAEYQSRMSALGSMAVNLRYFDNSMEERQDWLPITLLFTVGLGVACGVGRFVPPFKTEARQSLTVGAIGFLGIGCFLVLAVIVTQTGDQRWRSIAPPTQSRTWTAVPTPMAAAGPQAMEMAAPGGIMPPRPQRGAEDRGPDVPGSPPVEMMQPLALPPQGRAAGLPPRPGGEALRPIGLPDLRARAAKGVPAPLPPGATARLQGELWKIRSQAQGAGQPLSPLQQQAINRILESIPQASPLLVREYAHTRLTPPPGTGEETRADFTETLLWQPVLVLPQDGRATLTFALSDAIAPYRVLIAGHTLDGRIGAVTGTIEVRKPLAVDPKLPQEVSSADRLDVPVVLTNGTASPQSASVALTLDGLAADGGAVEFQAEVGANTGRRQLVRLTPTRSEGELRVKVNASAGPGLKDSIERKLTVVPDGFPVQGAASDVLEQVTRATVTLPPQWIPGTLKSTVTIYPNTLSELQAGLDGLMREPYGCFEQASTANYPNVLITEYLRETNQARPEISRRSRELMDRGYVRLTTYECPKSGSPARLGYEWFGAQDRPHEALTAYGLLQFTDMSRVYPVDSEMLERTKRFLLERRDGRGSFTRNARALDQFGRAPQHVTDAYIVWAITEAERTSAAPSDLSTELKALLARTREERAAQDPYFLSLVANALLNRGQQAEGVAVLKTVAKLQAADGSVPGAEASITMSGGRDLLVEATALATLGWLKANRPELFTENVRQAVGFIGSQRSASGAFGSTQSTILALKSLIEHARANRRPAESGELRVFVRGAEVARQGFSTESVGPVVIELSEQTLQPGANEVRIETAAKQAYPVSVAWSCRTRQPASSPDCPVRLTTTLARPEVEEAGSVRVDVTVENLSETPQGMTVAIIGLPAGLKLPEDMKQLRDLTARPADGTEPVVSYWETRGRELILYWRGLTPKQTVKFGLDLLADVPGEYRGPASRAYLYYNADHKHWVPPLDVRIRARE